MVTGASSGIGLATARLFAQSGAQVALIARDATRLDQAATAVGGVGLVADVRDPAAVTAAVAAAVDSLGGLDGLVCAAGINARLPIESVSDALWADVIATNLSGTFYTCRAALPHLSVAGTAGAPASIVTVASGGALLPPGSGYTAYAASKGGVVSLTKALAREAAPAVRVNCVLPGNASTPITQSLMATMTPTEREAKLAAYALGRIAEPLEIARAIKFLTSADSSYAVGTSLSIDGGRIFH
nr:SDR family NAD(P)-dependent oxidoreductase [Sphingomonas jinjuensis]